MADDILSALLGGAYGGPGAQDILGFQKSLQDNSTLRTAAAPILGARFDTRTWSPGTTAAVTAGQAFLGSIMNELAAKDEAAQIEKVTQILPSLYQDPMNILTPAGVDENAFAKLKQGALLNKTVSLIDIANKAKLAGAVKRAETEGERLANAVPVGGSLSSGAEEDSGPLSGLVSGRASTSQRYKQILRI